MREGLFLSRKTTQQKKQESKTTPRRATDTPTSLSVQDRRGRRDQCQGHGGRGRRGELTSASPTPQEAPAPGSGVGRRTQATSGFRHHAPRISRNAAAAPSSAEGRPARRPDVAGGHLGGERWDLAGGQGEGRRSQEQAPGATREKEGPEKGREAAATSTPEGLTSPTMTTMMYQYTVKHQSTHQSLCQVCHLSSLKMIQIVHSPANKLCHQQNRTDGDGVAKGATQSPRRPAQSAVSLARNRTTRANLKVVSVLVGRTFGHPSWTGTV